MTLTDPIHDFKNGVTQAELGRAPGFAPEAQAAIGPVAYFVIGANTSVRQCDQLFHVLDRSAALRLPALNFAFREPAKAPGTNHACAWIFMRISRFNHDQIW